MSLAILIAGVVAAFLGRPAWLLPAVPIILISLRLRLISESARRTAARQRELEAFAEAFEGFDGPVPTLDSMPAMGWPLFTLTFDSKEILDLAEAQGRIASFKAEIQKLYGHIVQGERFDVDRAVVAIYEGQYNFNFDHLERQFPDLARRRAQRFARRSVTIWSQINYWAGVVVSIGTALGTIALLFLGREFTKDALGVFAWPLTILWLASFFYVTTYLVFTRTGIWVRVLWLIASSLFVLGLTAALVSRNGDSVPRPANGSERIPFPQTP